MGSKSIGSNRAINQGITIWVIVLGKREGERHQRDDIPGGIDAARSPALKPCSGRGYQPPRGRA